MYPPYPTLIYTHRSELQEKQSDKHRLGKETGLKRNINGDMKMSEIKWMAHVIAVDPVRVYIICPICGNIHSHGSMGGKKDEDHYYGHRIKHCPINVSSDQIGYYLVRTEHTMYFDKVLKIKPKTIYRRYLESIRYCG